MTDAPSTASSGASSDWRRRAQSVLPWIVAAGMIAYVFSRVPIADAWAVARDARLGLFAGVMSAAVLTWFLIEAALYAYLFTRFNAPVDFREGRSLRGMSYLLTPIHWNVGKAAVILRLKQTKGIPILESTSTVMLYQALDGIILAGLATTGLTLLPLLVAEVEDLSEIRGWTMAIIALTLVHLTILRSNWPSFGWLVWWRGISIHRAHRRVTPSDLAILLSSKSAYHFLYVLVFYFGAKAFGIELPFALALAATPIIQAVGALPISPAGLGTQQAAMLYFFGSRFGGDAPEAAIVAFGFSFPVALILCRCLLGLFYVKDLTASRSLEQAGLDSAATGATASRP